MAVELGSGFDNPTFKTQKVTDVNVYSGDIYENFQRPEQYEQQKPKPNSDVTHKEAAAMMPNAKVHLVLVLVGIVSVLLLVSIGFFSWAGWKMKEHDEAIKKHSEETADVEKQTENLKTENEKLQNETEELSKHVENLNEKSQNETEKVNQTIQLIQKFNTFLINGRCNGSECLLCHSGWTFFNDSCYYFGEAAFTWDISRRFCQFKSADLVVINNLQEQKFIYDNMKRYHWLGLYRNGNDWYWIDGRIDTLKFWYWNFPSSSDSYVYMYRYANPTSSWVSVSNIYTFPPICEQKAFKLSLN